MVFRHKRNRKSFWVVKPWFTIKNLEICVSVIFPHVVNWSSLILGSRNTHVRGPPSLITILHNLGPGENAHRALTQVIWKFVKMRFQIMQLDAHIASQYVVSCQQLIDQILVVRWFSFQKKCVQQMKSICTTILTVSCSSLSFTACPIDMDPYLLPHKYGSMPIRHSVKTSFWTSYEESPFFIFALCQTHCL